MNLSEIVKTKNYMSVRVVSISFLMRANSNLLKLVLRHEMNISVKDMPFTTLDLIVNYISCSFLSAVHASLLF